MAGESSAIALTPYSIGSPQGVGYAGQPSDSKFQTFSDTPQACLLYTSDAADE